MNVHNFDIEKFISEVQKFPEIWDLKCEDYRYQKRKQRAWALIACEFISGFDDLPESEKVQAYKKLNDKWRNLRDSFVRAKRINSKKSYMYAKQLKFLKEVYKSSSQSEDEETSVEDRPKLKISKKTNRHYDCNSEDSNSDFKTKQKSDEDIEFVSTYPDATCCSNTNYLLEDEDKSFFYSLLPAVKEFSLDQKLEFRSEVLSLVKKIRQS